MIVTFTTSIRAIHVLPPLQLICGNQGCIRLSSTSPEGLELLIAMQGASDAICWLQRYMRASVSCLVQTQGCPDPGT